MKDNKIDGYKVSSSTVVYTITEVKDDDDDISGYEVKISKGQTALKGIDDSKLLAYEDGSTVVSYAFTWEDAKSTDVQYGIIDKKSVEVGTRETSLKIDGTKYVADEDSKVKVSDDDEGKIVAFTENEDGIMIKKVYSVRDMKAIADNGRITLDKVDSRMFTVNGQKVDLDDDTFEDITFVVVDYDSDDEEFTSLSTYTSDKVSLDDDYIYVASIGELKDVAFVFKGYEYPEEPTTEEFTVKFMNGGVQVGEDQKVKKDEKPTLPEDPTTEDDSQEFKGWKVEGAEDSTATKDLPAIIKDTTFVAVFGAKA